MKPAHWVTAYLVLGFLLLESRPNLWSKRAWTTEKVAFSSHGIVATGSPEATAAAIRILEAGGNAIDAAAAAHLALMVTDPANTSLAGRAQILLRLKNGRTIALDGATKTPTRIQPLKGEEDRRGYLVVPVPGNAAVVAQMVQGFGKLSLRSVLQPAIELAEKGFSVTPRLAASWQRNRQALAEDPGAALNFLKADGSAYKSGETFVQPRLARLLRKIASDGVEAFYRGEIAESIASDVTSHGGFIRKADLEHYRAAAGVTVLTSYRGTQVVCAGGRAWGNTLVEMLNILEHFQLPSGPPTARQVELLARVIDQALEDRPQEIGSLKPKALGFSLTQISSRSFAKERAALIKQKLFAPATPASETKQPATPDNGDTTHLSVIDSEGNAVALTTSIGPAFGARVATPELGFLYAHSYRMRADPAPDKRDETEMTPTIVLQGQKPRLVIGAAGSERIPSAILQVISNVLDRGLTLEQAVAEPRIFSFRGKLRMHPGFPEGLTQSLSLRGFEVEVLGTDSIQHLGLIHAASFDQATGEFSGAVDPASDGSAGGPK